MGLGAFVIGLSQIFSFFSDSIIYFFNIVTVDRFLLQNDWLSK